MAKSSDYPIVPVSIQYLYKDAAEKPTVYVVFDECLSSSADAMEIDESVSRGTTLIHQFHFGKKVDGFIPQFTQSKRRDALWLKCLSWFAKWKLS